MAEGGSPGLPDSEIGPSDSSFALPPHTPGLQRCWVVCQPAILQSKHTITVRSPPVTDESLILLVILRTAGSSLSVRSGKLNLPSSYTYSYGNLHPMASRCLCVRYLSISKVKCVIPEQIGKATGAHGNKQEPEPTHPSPGDTTARKMTSNIRQFLSLCDRGTHV